MIGKSGYRAGLVPSIGEVSALLDPTDGPWAKTSPILAKELAQVPDPRRAAGRRDDLVFLLSIVVMAVLAGARSLSGIRRWATGVDPAVLAVLARGGPIIVLVVSTWSRLLASLDGDAVDDAFARYTAAVLAPGAPDPFPQNLFEEPGDTTEPTDTTDTTENDGTAGTAENGGSVTAVAAPGRSLSDVDHASQTVNARVNVTTNEAATSRCGRERQQ